MAVGVKRKSAPNSGGRLRVCRVDSTVHIDGAGVLCPVARLWQRPFCAARLVLLIFTAMLTLGLPHVLAGDVGLGWVGGRVAPPDDAANALHQPASAPDPSGALVVLVRHPTPLTGLLAAPQLLSAQGVDFVRIG